VTARDRQSRGKVGSAGTSSVPHTKRIAGGNDRAPFVLGDEPWRDLRAASHKIGAFAGIGVRCCGAEAEIVEKLAAHCRAEQARCMSECGYPVALVALVAMTRDL
jgi:hypothetical protein